MNPFYGKSYFSFAVVVNSLENSATYASDLCFGGVLVLRESCFKRNLPPSPPSLVFRCSPKSWRKGHLASQWIFLAEQHNRVELFPQFGEVSTYKTNLDLETHSQIVWTFPQVLQYCPSSTSNIRSTRFASTWRPLVVDLWKGPCFLPMPKQCAGWVAVCV